MSEWKYSADGQFRVLGDDDPDGSRVYQYLKICPRCGCRFYGNSIPHQAEHCTDCNITSSREKNASETDNYRKARVRQTNIIIVTVLVGAAALVILLGYWIGRPHHQARLIEPGIQGKWRIESWTAGGHQLPRESIGDKVFSVDGATIDGFFSGIFTSDYQRASMKLDSGQTPARIDVTFETGPDRGETVYGIYRLEADTLTVCLGSVGQSRPVGFASEEGSGTKLYVAQRAK